MFACAQVVMPYIIDIDDSEDEDESKEINETGEAGSVRTEVWTV